ncbi:hypothetical protein WDW89_00245 [Deltaproteobacteria bacterium TL4]
MDEENNMLEGWLKISLGEVCEITSSKRIFAREYQSSGIPYFERKRGNRKI